ncbi:MAG: ester cyclase [Mucilaginibacter sp.]|uniref:ester cyclase n=1 Tax=Mucilaginibacter sp. TaxID=1882438 RepID=UPI0031A8D70D
MKTIIKIVVGLFLTMASINSNAQASKQTKETDSLRAVITQLRAANRNVNQNLIKFDTLDYTVFSNQQWLRFHESHAQNIKVFWPDGHVTVGLAKHLQDMKALFVHAPDTRIKQHPIRFGSGNFTAVTGVFEGTFTKPMPVGNGQFIKPTGKAFKIPMATIGIWKNGVMIEEHLFWDNKAYLDQIGIGK